jgi:hypothetical protein
VLFVNRENRHIGPFLEFLKDSKLKGQIKCLNKDQWDVFYEFSRSMDDEFTGYSDTAAWPSLFDDYVEWRRKQSGMKHLGKVANFRVMERRIYVSSSSRLHCMAN